MRLLFTALAALALAQCAGAPEAEETPRRRVPDGGTVIIGIAEAASNTSPTYRMLWRRLDDTGAFADLGGDRDFEVRSHEGGSIRVGGIPGEFVTAELEPGIYALDSVFAVIEDRRVSYAANGVIVGPERPSFEIEAGEVIYLGIWQVDLDVTTATATPWRLEESDLRAVLRESEGIRGDVRMRQVQPRDVQCAPRRLSSRSQRQVC